MPFDKRESIITNTVQEQASSYAYAETELLKEALKRSYAERFFFATRLYKIGQTLSKATIIHKQDTLTK